MREKQELVLGSMFQLQEIPELTQDHLSDLKELGFAHLIFSDGDSRALTLVVEHPMDFMQSVVVVGFFNELSEPMQLLVKKLKQITQKEI